MAVANDFQQDLFHTSSILPQKKAKPPPLVLSNTEAQYWPMRSPLAEFAVIATSPESPLVKEMSYGYESTNNMLKLPSLDHVTSPSDNHSFPIPTVALWERIQEYSGAFTADYNSMQNQERNREYSQTFDVWNPNVATNTSSLFRPHNMKEKCERLGDEQSSVPCTPWSNHNARDGTTSPRPPCRELQLSDVSKNPNYFENSTEIERSTTFFDLDSAAQALSNMAKRKEERVQYERKIDSTLHLVKRKEKRIRKTKNTNSNARRPMNAFMLFAKRFRLEITRNNPGKDNRAISVILGDEWKSLSSEARKVYVMEAKTLAEEHKRIYPDCWKRKCTTQVSSRGNRKH